MAGYAGNQDGQDGKKEWRSAPPYSDSLKRLARAACSPGNIVARPEKHRSNGLGILLGGGAAYLRQIEATDGVTTISRNGGLYPNLEAGLRFLFI